MFERCDMIPTKDMTRPEWLAARRTGIGGSDAAAVAGLSPWATPYTVYLDKLGLLQEQEETEAMRQGRDLEEYVAQRFMEATGKKVNRCNFMVRNPKYPFAVADIDRRVVGENAGLECKTTSSLNVRQFNGVDFPDKYYAQCLHYMAVTGAERWYLAVLVLGREFHVYCLERDEAEISALMGMEDAFWAQVQDKEPPDITGHHADTAAIGTLWAESNGGEEADLLGTEETFSFLEAVEKQIQTLQGFRDAYINEIKERMATAERGYCGGYCVSWKTQQRRTLDRKALAADYPDIDFDKYMKVSTSRPFKWKRREEQ